MHVDPRLVVRLEREVELAYADGGSAGDDRLPYVRAASAIRRWGDRLVVVQDDVNVLAVGSLDMPRQLDAVLLPEGPDRRRRFDDLLGNRDQKLDLEAAAVLPDGRLVAFGSGTTPVRERLAIVGRDAAVRMHDARAFYAQLRAEEVFAGSELNIEGAVVAGNVLTLVQRGNGAERAGRGPVNAIAEVPLDGFVAWLDGSRPLPPPLTRIVRLDLGRVDGARLSLTDVALRRDGRLVFVACAEDSPDAVRDGALLGCRFGVLAADGARMADITAASGTPVSLKVEGIESRPADPTRFDVVVDADDPTRPAIAAVLQVTDPP